MDTLIAIRPPPQGACQPLRLRISGCLCFNAWMATVGMRCISPVWGAAAGDIVGSVYEHRPHKSEDFPLLSEACRFTDDTVLTAAIAHAITAGEDYAPALRRYGRAYPDAGYGAGFSVWLFDDRMGPYNSFGNGAAMRVSAVGAAFDTETEVMEQARLSAAVTHDHPEGIKGAQAAALAVYLGRTGAPKGTIRDRITGLFGYDLDRTIGTIRRRYAFDVSCQGSVPESVLAFLESNSTEDAIRKAVSLGGDADTMACIAGAIAAAFYGTAPSTLIGGVYDRLTPELIEVFEAFDNRFGWSASQGAVD